jgi:hypothetical protein
VDDHQSHRFPPAEMFVTSRLAAVSQSPTTARRNSLIARRSIKVTPLVQSKFGNESASRSALGSTTWEAPELRGIVLVAAAHTILITIIVLWRWLRG